jgi:Protein of unknown function (DUF1538)
MSGWLLEELGNTGWSVLVAVLPLTLLFVGFQLLLLRLPGRDFRNILVGTLLASTGLFLFLLGVSIGFLPAGREIGEALGRIPQKWALFPIGVFLGFLTTWSEPAVRILAKEVEEASNGSIRSSVVLHTICAGVAFWVGLGLLRIAYGVPLLYLLVPGYALVMVLLFVTSRDFVAIAVDAGGVATGPMANTFLLALALGAAASIDDQNPIANGLGLVALIAVAPVISVMTLGLAVRWRELPKE